MITDKPSVAYSVCYNRKYGPQFQNCLSFISYCKTISLKMTEKIARIRIPWCFELLQKRWEEQKQAKNQNTKWNVTPLIRRGSNFLCSIFWLPPWTLCSVCLSLLFFIACLPSRRRREAMRASMGLYCGTAASWDLPSPASCGIRRSWIAARG